MRTSTVTAYLRARAASGASLLEAADEIDAGALRADLAMPPVVRRPRQIATLPEEDQPAALAADARKVERQRGAGTMPKTMPPIPRGTK